MADKPYMLSNPDAKFAKGFEYPNLVSGGWYQGYDIVGVKPNGVIICKRRNWFIRTWRKLTTINAYDFPED